MVQTKQKEGFMSEDIDKNKLILLEKQNRALKKSCRNLRGSLKAAKKSRDNWKNKYKELKLNDRQVSGGSGIFEGPKAKNYSYSLLMVAFCANIQAYGAMSLRACVHVLFCLQMALGEQKRLASYSSIRMWVIKLGKYRIENQAVEKEPWVCFIDESIHIGNEKILLVLGLPEKDLDFQNALCLSQLRVLHMEVSSQWKGEDISGVLLNVQKRIPIAYMVSDQGNNLKKACLLSEIKQVSDCTHALSKGIEKAYKRQELFAEFCLWAGTLRRKWPLKTDRKAYLPPSQRNKVRFANLFPLVKWAKQISDNWPNLSADLQRELKFIKENQAWILNFWQIQEQVVQISRLLKTEGYSQTQHGVVLSLLKNSSEEGLIFEKTVKNYLAGLAENLEERTQLYCCSDVIESAFGKLKQKLSKNNHYALSNFMLCLASVGGQYACEEVRKALENIKDKDLRKT